MQQPTGTRHRSSRRFLVAYWLFIAAAVVGSAILNRAVDVGDRPIAFVVVGVALGFAIAAGLLLMARVLRER